MRKYRSTSVFFVVTAVLSICCLLSVKCQSIGSKTEIIKFSIFLSIPGIKIGPDFQFFKRVVERQIDKVGVAMFGDIPHESRMKNTFFESTLIPKCIYYRIAFIFNSFVQDLKNILIQLRSATQDVHCFYMSILSAWYLDRAFLVFDCGAVNIKNLIYLVMWKFIVQWSIMLKSEFRNKFCIWFKALGETASKILSHIVICFLFSNEKIAYISLYSLRQKAPTEIANTFHVRTKNELSRKAILFICFKMLNDFRNSGLTFVVRVLNVFPKIVFLPCEFTAQFPSIGCVICAVSKSFSHLRVYIQTYHNVSQKEVHNQNAIIPHVDYEAYIKPFGSTQKRNVSENHSENLDVAVADVKNNIQDIFHHLGAYFKKVKIELTADITYIKGCIENYKMKFRWYSKELSKKMKVLFRSSVSSAAGDVADAKAKIVTKISKANNHFKWITASGNADDIMELQTGNAQAAEHLNRAKRSTVNFIKLIDYNKNLARKLPKYERMIQNIGSVIKNVKKSTDDSFGKHQFVFRDNFTNYSSQVAEDDLSKLDYYWDLSFDEVFDWIASIGGVVANSKKGTSGYFERLLKAKIQARQIVACQEETYDLQFEYMGDKPCPFAVISKMEQLLCVRFGCLRSSSQ